MNHCSSLARRVRLFAFAVTLTGILASPAAGQSFEDLKAKRTFKGRFFAELASSGGIAMVFGREAPVSSPGESKRGGHDHGRGGNTFVNDPCLDPPPTAPFPNNFFRTVQSETELAVLNTQGSMGKKIVAGYNDSFGFDDNRQGLSGFAYSTNGGNTWIDGGGLPPRIPTGLPSGTLGQDAYFGDPVIVVHHQSETFYYSSIYQTPTGFPTLSVNRGRFTSAPPPVTESVSNTRCLNNPELSTFPDVPSNQKERISWEPPVEAVAIVGATPNSADFLDKEWLYVDQNTGTLYMTYTRFQADGATPIELVRCIGCANIARPLTSADWTAPSIIVPNEPLEFNQATMPFTTPTGRVIVTWFAREFGPPPSFPEVAQRIEYAYAQETGNPAPLVFTPEQLVTVVDPQGEPPGYNRARLTILNAPYIFVDRGADDGVFTAQERARPGFGNVYITYFDGVTPILGAAPPTPLPAECAPPNTLSRSRCNPFVRAARILLSTSRDNGLTFESPVQVNDDATLTTHVFPSVQANKNGDVYVAWIDRRQDPEPFVPGSTVGTTVTPFSGGNIFNDTYAAVSKNLGASFGHNKLQTSVSTNWFTREDARPDYGDYNSSELLGFNQFVTIWADGRFRPPGGAAATPDVIFTIGQGLGAGNDPNPDR